MEDLHVLWIGIKMRARLCLVAAAILLAFTVESAAQTYGCAATGTGPSFASSGFVSVMYSDSFPNPGAISHAATFWNESGCGDSGGSAYDYPYFAVLGSFSRQLTINWQAGHSESRGCTHDGQPSYCTAQRSGSTVTVFSHWGPNGDIPTTTSTATLGNLIAHEVGHTLGLGDSWCGYGGIMNLPVSGAPMVTADECFVVDNVNHPPGEPPDGCSELSCQSSPIVIDLELQGYGLTGLGDPAYFDIDADGSTDILGWTARGTELGFLWLDRNSNSHVDNGSELFGTSTPLSGGGTAENGFEALKGFDINNDGIIDAGDNIWRHLLLWVDRDHDGNSSPSEISRIAESRVAAIQLAYHTLRRRDQHGNLFRYAAPILMERPRGGTVRATVYDIFFVIYRP